VIHTWNELSPLPLQVGTSCHSATRKVFTPSLSVAIRSAPPSAGLRSVHHGATTLFGAAASGNESGGWNSTSADVPPPTTR
jgi:hypothetical protein